jgi:hypothetical protein
MIIHSMCSIIESVLFHKNVFAFFCSGACGAFIFKGATYEGFFSRVPPKPGRSGADLSEAHLNLRVCVPNNFWQSSNLAVQNGFISRGSSGLPQLFRVAGLTQRPEAGGVRVQFLEFLQHSVCTGTLYCVLIARTQGSGAVCPFAHEICTGAFKEKTLSSQQRARRDRAQGNCSCSCGEGCGGRAVAARRARRARDTVEEEEEVWGEEEKNPREEGGREGGQGDKEGEGSEEEVEEKEGEVLEGGERADDDEYEKAAPPPLSRRQ